LQGGFRSGARSDVPDKKIEFADYAETRFSDGARSQTAWRYEAGAGTAQKSEGTRLPAIDRSKREGKLVVHADLPGLRSDDVGRWAV
jgi:HSP20 family molecular chaperone IbpA